MFVVTADQRRSRRAPDLVPVTLEALARAVPSPALPFERTVGDELQGVLDRPGDVLAVISVLVRDDAWSVGIGVGPVERPLPATTRAVRGGAPVAARDAVEHARRRVAPRVSLRASPRASPGASGDGAGTLHADAAAAEALLRLLAEVLGRRSREAWEVVDLVRAGSTHRGAGATLGVSRQAVGQRLAAAGWDVEEGAVRVLTGMLADLDRAVDPQAPAP